MCKGLSHRRSKNKRKPSTGGHFQWRRFFDSAFHTQFSPHGKTAELGVRENVTSVIAPLAGGGELACEKTTGIVGFEEMKQSHRSINLVPYDHRSIQE